MEELLKKIVEYGRYKLGIREFEALGFNAALR